MKTSENPYLIRFTYDHYCQGYETETETVLVYATNVKSACLEIKKHYKNARDFFSLTFVAGFGKVVE